MVDLGKEAPMPVDSFITKVKPESGLKEGRNCYKWESQDTRLPRGMLQKDEFD